MPSTIVVTCNALIVRVAVRWLAGWPAGSQESADSRSGGGEPERVRGGASASVPPALVHKFRSHHCRHARTRPSLVLEPAGPRLCHGLGGDIVGQATTSVPRQVNLECYFRFRAVA